MVQIRDDSFLSIQITEEEFDSEEIDLIKEELKSCSKTDLIIAALKSYLKQEEVAKKEDQEPGVTDKLEELKLLVEENHSLLQELNKNKVSYASTSSKDTYNDKKQQAKTEQALNLLNQF
ncbi:hypothetical protein [Halobacteroides halobius]|uniref:hypothetical protein n=1 Tax=Halobacteroides halobius TaxID=42422 RepID=UPI0012EA1E09|nr:hypothetical protein [Halobacteroides halobius]